MKLPDPTSLVIRSDRAMQNTQAPSPSQTEFDILRMKAIVLLKNAGLLSSQVKDIIHHTPIQTNDEGQHFRLTQLFIRDGKKYRIVGDFIKKPGHTRTIPCNFQMIPED